MSTLHKDHVPLVKLALRKSSKKKRFRVGARLSVRCGCCARCMLVFSALLMYLDWAFELQGVEGLDGSFVVMSVSEMLKEKKFPGMSKKEGRAYAKLFAKMKKAYLA